MSTAEATLPAKPKPAAAPDTGLLDDFSDKLSPMLVKELRQGLRGKTFVILFLALQAMLAVVMLATIAASSPGGSGQGVSSVIFFFFSLAVLVVQPLRGIGALHNEIKGNTIDLMVLTRLGAWRIVLGKWVAIVSQSALLLTAIIPYLILRYFFGQMNLFAELLLLLLIFLGSAAFTALTVGLSAIGTILVRGLVPLVVCIMVVNAIFALSFGAKLADLVDACALQSEGSFWRLLLGILTAAYVAWSALSFGASMIAPMAENHSSLRRAVAIGTVILAGLFAAAGDLERNVVVPLLIFFCAPAIAIALTEPLQLLPPICRPFVRYGAPGRILGRIFYPGWPSGVFFTVLLALVAFAVYWLTPMISSKGGVSINPVHLHVPMLMAFGGLLLPGVVLRLFGKKVRQSFAFYLLVLVVSGGITLALAMITADAPQDASYAWFFCWVPPVQGLLMELTESVAHIKGNPTPNYSHVLMAGLITSGAYLAILGIFAMLKFPEIREIEEEALTKPESLS